MVERVLFYETTLNGQILVCTVESDDARIKIIGDNNIADILLKTINQQSIHEIMVDAPRQFDGSYLRAKYEVIE